jgi:probable rRNA maturation factor
LLESGSRSLDGQIVVSADTAERVAPQYGWSTDEELLLYVIHGALHLVGYDDTTDAARRRMRSGERFYLERMGIAAPAGDASGLREGPGDSQPRGDGA